MTSVKLLLFDVFGTLVDWHGSIAREVDALGLMHRATTAGDGATFAKAWRAQYQPAMEAVRAGRIPFSKLDVLHRHNLDRVLASRGLHDVDEATRVQLNRAWHRLDAWPEVPAALARLRERHLVAPCSNGNISLMVALARRNRLPWDAILGAELARDYKPRPVVYLNACEALDCAPHEVMMVAAHSTDLAAAAACGLRTAHVARPDEHGPGIGERAASIPVDRQAQDLADLATQLGC
jgi:2-haloacid dehalogenase